MQISSSFHTFGFNSNQIKISMIIDLFQDKRVVYNKSTKKRLHGKGILPQIKYTPSVLRKMQEDIILAKDTNNKICQMYNQPLSNILVSKRIHPPCQYDQLSPSPYVSKKIITFKGPQIAANNFTSNQKQSGQPIEKYTDILINQRNSTSLSYRKTHNKRVRMDRQIKQYVDTQQYSSPQQVRIRNVNKVKPNELLYVLSRANNNQELIKRILDDRKVWKQIKWGEAVPHFKWVFGKDKNYKKLFSYNQKRSINHFQFNEELTTKDNLVRNLQIYCQTKKLEIFSLTPVTFIIDFDDQYCQYNLKQFLSFFMKNDPRKTKKQTNNYAIYSYVNKFMGYMNWQNSDIKKKVNILSRPINNTTYYNQNSYIWLLKPTGLNRGRGIQIFDSLEQLQKILMDYLALMNRKKINQKVKDKQHKDSTTDPQACVGQSKFSSEKFKLKTCSFIIQKYVQKPFLIEGRKFDIRVWVLLTQNLKIYFFKQGYIRTATETYSTEDIENYFIHLTNNAIQKNSQNYGQFQSGNQLPFRALSRWLSIQTVQQIWEKIKQISYMAFSSAKKKINQQQRKNCFQIFGLDYIIDAENKVWLIQINENPCLQESSPFLKQIIPRMVSDAFKLTIDQIFYEKKPEEASYPVNGYKNNINMWENIGLLAPNADYSPSKNQPKFNAKLLEMLSQSIKQMPTNHEQQTQILHKEQQLQNKNVVINTCQNPQSRIQIQQMSENLQNSQVLIIQKDFSYSFQPRND